jgi:peptide/nickel transport system substrate-binding protein
MRLHFPSIPAPVKTLYDHMSNLERGILSALVLLLLASGITSLINIVYNNTKLVPQIGGSYREAAVGQPRYLNPVLAGANDIDVDITRLVYSGLFRLDANLQLQNDLATGYEVAQNQQEYTVRLRSDVRWHDGEPLTADDVIFTIRSIQTPDYGSPLGASFQGVEIEKVDDHTILFKLKQPYAPFLHSLTVGIVPEHVWSAIAPQNALLAEQMLKPVGSGPFRFSELATRRKTGEITSLRLLRNEHYYGKRPYLDEISILFYATHDDALQALAGGKVDGIGFLPLHLREKVADRRSLQVHRLLLPQYFGLFFNQQRNSILGEAGVRSALALATNRRQIVDEALQGEGDPLHLPIPPDIVSPAPELQEPAYNPEAAKQNLKESGWEDADGNGIREKKDQQLKVKITTTDWPEYVRTAEIIRDQWKQIGVEVEIESLGAGIIQQAVVQPREYEILLFGEILTPNPDPYPFWHSTQTRSPGLNFSLFRDKDVDRLLEDARKITDPEQRNEKYRQFEGKILDLNPAIILYRPYYLFATKQTVRGVEAHLAGLPSGRFNNSENWHVRVRRVRK